MAVYGGNKARRTGDESNAHASREDLAKAVKPEHAASFLAFLRFKREIGRDARCSSKVQVVVRVV